MVFVRGVYQSGDDDLTIRNPRISPGPAEGGDATLQRDNAAIRILKNNLVEAMSDRLCFL
jgi:hypothetical protein